MPAPTREEVEKVFEVADKDKSGKLSFKEFKSAMLDFASNEDERKQFQMEGFAEMIFDVLGEDGDKELSVDQVMKFIDGGFDEKKMMMRMLKTADKDGDGYISTEELRKMVMMMDPDDDPTDMANMIIKMCGGAKEKKVKPEAVMDFFGMVDADQKDPKEQAKLAFKMFDTNGDGYINKGELAGYMSSMLDDDEDMNDPIMNMMLKMMIAEHDKDKDGKLNFDEFCNFMDKN